MEKEIEANATKMFEDLKNQTKNEKLGLKPGLYSVKDTKLGKMGLPFIAPNDDIAKRMLAETMQNNDTTISKYPEDFQLFKLGEYDELTGELINNFNFLANATEFKKE